MLNYRATLQAAGETSPNAGAATGSLEVIYDTDTTVVSWTAVYSGLAGLATTASFNDSAPDDRMASVMLPLIGSSKNPVRGWARLTEEQAKALTAGRMVFNLRTGPKTSGEIGGRVVPETLY